MEHPKIERVTMEKPRKLHVMEGLIDNSNVLSNRELSRKVRNDTIDAMSTWLEGEMESESLLTEIEVMIGAMYPKTGVAQRFKIAQQAMKIIKRKLTGKV